MNNLFKTHLKTFEPKLSTKPVQVCSAVAVLICGAQEHEEVLMFQRAIREKDPWSGHIAFPGGRQEPEDQSLWHTAVRETQEEMGIDLNQAEYLGQLNDLHHPKIMVSAFVFHMPQKPPLTPNHEVQKPLWIEIKDVFDKNNHSRRLFNTFNGEHLLPSVAVNDVVIWGISLSFLSQIESMWV